jgi:hypothetical protein
VSFSIPTSYTYKGETKTIQEWADHWGVSKETMRNRFRKGMPEDEIMSPRFGRGGRVRGQVAKNEPIIPKIDNPLRHAKWI